MGCGKYRINRKDMGTVEGESELICPANA